MILTITANPSVDISYILDELTIDGVNRTEKVNKSAGGKGLNVGNVLSSLGSEVIYSGFIGGALGDFIEDTLDKKGGKSRFVRISEVSRNCIAILHGKNQTEILEKGPEIKPKERDLFLESLGDISKGCEIISISGSLPKGLDPSFYEKIIKYGKENDKFVAVDTSGASLERVIKADFKPDMIKPNEDELSDLLKTKVSKENLKEILLEDTFKDIKIVLVSLGKDGAVVKIGPRVYEVHIPKVKAINPVGSGDSSVAGALHAIENKKRDIELIKTSMTCGILNVLNPETATIDISEFDKYYEKVLVEEI